MTKQNFGDRINARAANVRTVERFTKEAQAKSLTGTNAANSSQASTHAKHNSAIGLTAVYLTGFYLDMNGRWPWIARRVGCLH